MILVGLVLIMAIGYAAFAQSLNINGDATINSKWDVHIEDISVNNESLGGKSIQATVGEDGLTASFDAELTSPGSSVTYNVTVRNSGTIDAKLDVLTFSDSGNDAIQYSYANVAENDVLNSNQTQTFTVTVAFNDSYTSMPTSTTNKLTMYLNYVQA